MKLTKLVHSCLLVETAGKKALVDPGNYSWQSGLVRPENLTDIDIVVITHNHPDHLDESFVRAIYAASPNAQWYGTLQAVNQLGGFGITAQSESHNDDVRFITSEHANLSPWVTEQPEHTSYVLFNEILIGGDCHTLTNNHGARIFAGAVSGGPWGAVVGYTKMIAAMSPQPEIVVPLHDWHWNDEARQAIYARLPEVMNRLGATFVALENGQGVEV